MPTDVFEVIAEPRRREILAVLREGPSSVGGLVERLGTSQPTVSKHLRVLRDSGFVVAEVVAQSRIYRLQAAPLEQLASWLQSYRHLWDHHFAALGAHLDDTYPQTSGVDDDQPAPDADR